MAISNTQPLHTTQTLTSSTPREVPDPPAQHLPQIAMLDRLPVPRPPPLTYAESVTTTTRCHPSSGNAVAPEPCALST